MAEAMFRAVRPTRRAAERGSRGVSIRPRSTFQVWLDMMVPFHLAHGHRLTPASRKIWETSMRWLTQPEFQWEAQRAETARVGDLIKAKELSREDLAAAISTVFDGK